MSEKRIIESATHSGFFGPDPSWPWEAKGRIGGSLTVMHDSAVQGKLDLGNWPWNARGKHGSMSAKRDSTDMATLMPFPPKGNCQLQHTHTKY